jgi:hypothetical protein
MLVGKDKLVKSVLVNDVNNKDIPNFTQLPFQKPYLFGSHNIIGKPETNYAPSYHLLSQKMPEVQHVRKIMT